MAADVRVVFTGDNRSALRAADGTRKGILEVGDASKRSNPHLKTLGTVGKIAGAALLGVGVIAAGVGGKMVGLASDAAEVDSKLNVIFGKTLPGLKKEVDAFAASTGASSFQLREQVADMGALLKPLTENTKAAGDMSFEFVKLATDLSSFNNVPVEESLLAIRSGLVGESEPLRRFGVLLNEGAVQAEAYRLGLAKAGQELTEQEKVQARASLIMQQTTLAQGDAERTAGSFANQLRAVKNGLTDAGTAVGVILMPYLLQFLQFVNANMPTIRRVMVGTIEAIIAVIDFLVPAIRSLIDWFRQARAATEEHWPRIRAIIQTVVDWFRANVLPTIQSVIQTIQRLWARFGDEIMSVVRATFGVLATVIGGFLRNVVAVIQGILALLRGDWQAAWEALKAIVSNTLSTLASLVKQILSGLVPAVLGLAADIGRAIIQGIISGFTSLLGSLRDTLVNGVKGAVGGLSGALGIDSPSRLMADEIGKPMAEGVIRGWIDGSRPLPDVMKVKVREAIDAARSAVEERRGAFASAFQALTSEALAAFDKLASDIETKTEKKIRLMDERSAAADRKAAIAEARRDLAGAQSAVGSLAQDEGESAEDFARRAAEAQAAVVEAQKRVDEALAVQQRFQLEQQAARERAALENRMALKRRHFEEDLLALQNYATRHTLTAEQMNKKLLAIFAKYGVPFKESTRDLGLALAEGLRESIDQVAKAAEAVRREVLDRLSNIEVRFSYTVQRRDDPDGDSKPSGRARGGFVRAGTPYIVGEEGRELFIPSQSGRIISNSALRASGGGSMGAAPTVVNVNVRADGFMIGDRQSLGEEIATMIVRYLPDGHRVAAYPSRA